MLSRVLPAAALALALLAGCADGDGRREAGSAVTEEEADLLAGLLHRNHTDGGADFVVTAPYGPGSVLTLTGEVDFREGLGRAQAVVDVEDVAHARSLFFTREDLWIGDLPDDESLPADVAYLHRPLAGADEPTRPLVDVLVTVLLGLSAEADDEPAAFLDGGYTWEGRRSIDGRPTALFGLPGDRTVAVSSTDDVLVQFTTPVPAETGDLEVTTTLAEHGRRALDLPAETQTASAGDHPELAASLGL
ncbi:hypothetical protein [Blastococcus sp. CCUG 61487]|uniref:hypothetical protein n=1 Tax=Blastococcus sp. CCUG 61487 TaxID=1840703 RepID=UPI0010C0EA93|nr:hypothetical protein [Blastococcus sp. CCUG 61487]TKJ26477.1 hypothetical protein A6V29_03830 [Blastococcus sp. CCUG 61487]